jgi:hypothetical protein
LHSLVRKGEEAFAKAFAEEPSIAVLRHPPVTESIVSLIFALAVIAHRLKLKMRHVGQFVGRNHAAC